MTTQRLTHAERQMTDQPTRNEGKLLLVQIASALSLLADLSPDDQRYCAALSRRIFKANPPPFPEVEKPLLAVAELLEYLADGGRRN